MNKSKFSFFMVIVLVLSVFANIQPAGAKISAESTSPKAEKSNRIPDTLILEVKDGVSLEYDGQGRVDRKYKTNSPELYAALASVGLYSVKQLFPPGQAKRDKNASKLERVYRLKLKSNTNLDAVVTALSGLADVTRAEPDYYIQADDNPTPTSTPTPTGTPPTGPVNDPRYSEQWALPAIGAPSAWAQMPADASTVTVAVIDSGICASHSDLVGRIISGWDFLESDAVPQDDFGHGCSVAGVIAANIDNSIGIAGVTPNAQIMPLRVLNASGVGSYSDVASAIVYAADNGAQVINLSLGGSNPSTTLENAVNYAILKNIFVVAAAGNNGTEGALYPAAYPNVIGVGSVDSNLQHSSFSNYGPQIDIWAPGRDILTTKRDGSYGLVSGTSFAAPYVAGAVVVVKGQGANLVLGGTLLTLGTSLIPTSTPTPGVTATTLPTITSVPTTGSTETPNQEQYGLVSTFKINVGNSPDDVGISPAAFERLPVGPSSIIVDTENNIFILDTINTRVLKLNFNQKQIDTAIKFEKDIFGADIAIDAVGNYYIADSRLDKIFLYNQNGESIDSLSVAGIDEIVGVEADSSGKIRMNGLVINKDSPSLGATQSSVEIVSQNNSMAMGTDKLSSVGIFSGNINLILQGTSAILTGPDFHTTLQISSPQQIASIPWFGIDGENNIYLLVETFANGSESVVSTEATIMKYKSDSHFTTSFSIPNYYYAMPQRRIALTSDGSLYQMLVADNAVNILKWSNTPKISEQFDPTPYFYSSVDFSETQLESSSAWNGVIQSSEVQALSISRSQVINNAEAYRTYGWVPGPANCGSRTCPDANNPSISCPASQNIFPSGQNVVGVPYQWGGYDTISQFSSKLSQGYLAGDSSGFTCVSSCATGVDCSGYVSVGAWNTSRHTTNNISLISTLIPSKFDVKAGDIFNKYGSHVVLFSYFDGAGNPIFYEATPPKVRLYSGWTYLNGYEPRRYNNIVDDGGGGGTCDATSVPSGYTKCAEEGGGNCNFSGSMSVYYGANSCYKVQTKTNGVNCVNESFGGDPLPGVHKACYINNPPPPSCPQSGGVILYWNANYNCNNSSDGYRIRSSTGWQNVNDGSFNDKASSVKVPSGWSVMLYENADRGGGKVCYNTDIGDFGTQGNFPGTSTSINDSVSSMEAFSDSTCGGANLPSAPGLSSPGNGSSNAYNYDVNLQWNSVSNATGYFVELWGGPYGTMQPCVWISSTSCHIGVMAQGNTYYWHVKARNGSGEGGWSSTWSFTIQTQPTAPPAPSLSSPGNGSSNPYNYDLTFQWNSAAGATSYLVEWWGGTYSTMQPCVWISSTSCHIGTVIPGYTYSWHVKARNGYGDSGWSPTWTFAIQNAPLPDLVPFPRPGASDPVVVSRWSDSPYTETLLSGQDAYYYWGYKNAGASNAGAHHVKVYIDNNQLIDYPFSGLGADSLGGFDNWIINSYVAPGPHQVKIVVDANGEVNESNESNNTWTGTVYWRDPTVQINSVFTTDDLGPAQLDKIIPAGNVKPSAYKDTFNLGDPIQLYLEFTNEFLDDRTFTCEWQVINPAGRVVPEFSETAPITIGAGGWWWGRDHTIPMNALRGQYTFIGKITYNGVTTTQSTIFTVDGPSSVDVYDAFVTDVNGNAASLEATPQRSAASSVRSNSVSTFNAGDGIQLYIDTYNDVADNEPASFVWEVIDPWNRPIDALQWSGDLSSPLDRSWWYLDTTIPTNAITGDYTFTGYITYNGKTTQQSQVFHVDGPAGPSNDSFSAPILISSVPYSGTQDTWGATTAANDPTPTCGAGQNSNSVWYKYVAPANGLMEVDTWGSDYDTVLTVWTGTAGNLTQIQCNDDLYGFTEAWLENVPVTAGVTYYIEVMDYGNPGGGALEIYINFAPTPSNNDFNTPTVISAIPYSITADVRGATQASDDPSLTTCNRLPGSNSVWYKYTTSTLSGQLDVDTIGSDYDTMLAVWTGTRGNLTLIGCNDDIGYVNEIWNTDSTLTLQLQPSTIYYIEASEFNGVIDINGPSATGVQNKPGQLFDLGEDSRLQDKKAAVEKGDISLTTSQGNRGGDVGAQLWGGQLQLHANYHPVPTTPTLVSPVEGTTLARTNNTLLDWNTTGTTCTVHVWGGSIDISPSGGCADLLLGEQRGGAYSWQVTAENAYGSAIGPIWHFNVRPYAPTSLSGLAVSATQVNLTWTLSNDEPADIDGYDVYKNGTLIGSVGAGVNQYPVTTGITCNTSYAYLVRAKRQNIQSINSNTVNVTAPCNPTAFNKTSPAANATNQPVNLALSWGVSTNAVKYEYCIDTTNNSACDTSWVNTGMTTSAALTNLAPATPHYWQVRAVNSIGAETYANTNTWWTFTTGTLPGAFTKSSPSDGATFQPVNLTLSWNSSAGATSYKYCYNTSPTCTTWSSAIATTSVVISGLSYDTIYYWHVQAINSIGSTYSDGNTWFSFTTGHLPGAFTKDQPSNLATGVLTNPTLSWFESTDATSYEYCLSTIGTGCTTWISVGNQIHIDLSGLVPATTYYWNVRAKNAVGIRNASDAQRSFTIGSVPAAFNKSAPANLVQNQPETLTLNWVNTTGETGYDYCVDAINNTTCDSIDGWIPLGENTNNAIISGLEPSTTYYWQVRANNSFGSRMANAGAWWNFKTMAIPGVFSKSTPNNLATNVSLIPTLSWAASANATRYEYCYDEYNDGLCDGDNWINNGTSTSSVLGTSLLENTTYYWQARAFNTFGTTLANSGNWYSFTTGAAPGVFTKIGPADGDTFQPISLTLSWASSSGSTSYKYCLSTTPTCTTWSSAITTTSKAVSGLSYDTTYYWHVRATNAIGTTYSDGDTWHTFTTGHLPGVFIKDKPSNLAIGIPPNPTLSWFSSTDAASYEYCLSTVSTGCTNWTSVGNQTFVNLSGLIRATKYYWNVRARNIVGIKISTDTQRAFTTGTIPAAFNKSAPANMAQNQLGIVALKWVNTTGETGYEYCIDSINNITCDSADGWVTVGADTTIAQASKLAANTTYYWQVRAVNVFGRTNANAGVWWSFKTTVIPGLFNKSNPPNLTLNVSKTPTLNWTASTNFTKYEYCIDTTNDNLCENNNWINNNTSTSVALGSPLLESTVYYWQVRAVNSVGMSNANTGVWWSFTIEGPPVAFNKISPNNLSVDQRVNPTLSWSISPNASRYEYCIDATDDSLCDGTWIDTGSNISVTVTGLATTTTYYWHVRAYNNLGTQDSDGNIWWSFTTGELSGEFNKINPSMDAIDVHPIPTIDWISSLGATSYLYCVDTINNDVCDTSWTPTINLSIQLNPLTPSTNYYWQVKAVNNVGEISANIGIWWHFTTRAMTIQQLVTRSAGVNDGWILESAENSNKGSSLDSISTTFKLGDDAIRKQYRGILSFNTAGLPDNAVITSAKLKIMKQGVIGGGNPVTIFQGFMVDIKNGFFSTIAGLQSNDFQATANKSFGPFKPALISNWYSIDLTSGGSYINKLTTGSGLTQIRLRFNLDDNNNGVANYLSLFSGNAPLASRPQLIIQYYVP